MRRRRCVCHRWNPRVGDKTMRCDHVATDLSSGMTCSGLFKAYNSPPNNLTCTWLCSLESEVAPYFITPLSMLSCSFFIIIWYTTLLGDVTHRIPLLLFCSTQQKQRRLPRSSQRAQSPRRAQGSIPRSTSTDPRPCPLSASPNMPEKVFRARTNWVTVLSNTLSPQSRLWSSSRIATPSFSSSTSRPTNAKSSKRWRICTRLNAIRSTLLSHRGDWRRVMFVWARISTPSMLRTGLGWSKWVINQL